MQHLHTVEARIVVTAFYSPRRVTSSSPIPSLPGERRWTVYGLVLTTPHRFANHVVRTSAPADLWVRPVEAAPIAPGWQDLAPAYRSDLMIDDDQHFLDVIVAPNATVFHFSEVVDFFVLEDGIACHVHDAAYDFMVELHLLGYVLSYWLERAGHLALHASGVVVDDHVIGFLGERGAGKTSLAATMIARGYSLATDDLLGLTPTPGGYLASPGYPQMRMWPEQARHFFGHDRFERVKRANPKLRVPVGRGSFGAFDGAVRPLAALYAPQRHDGDEVTFQNLPAGPAMFHLARTSYLVGIVEGAGLAVRRFAILGDLVARVPVRVVRYPNGLDRLPEIAERIADNARSLVRGSSTW